MSNGADAKKSRRLRLIFGFVVAIVVAGGAFSGAAALEIERMWQDILDRPSGPLALRFLLQPGMSALFAIRDGLADARTGRSPYFWTVVADPDERWKRLHEGIIATAKIIFLALLLDGVYQYIEFKTFYPAEALAVALGLGFIPYLLIRGPVARLARMSSRDR